MIKDLDLFILRFESFGREFPKSQNMSPDSFIQLALQLTYYKYGKHFVPNCRILLVKPKYQNLKKSLKKYIFFRIHGKLVSTYESASVRRFRLGRVDNIRANTPDALEWIRAMIGEIETTVINHLVCAIWFQLSIENMYTVAPSFRPCSSIRQI